MQHYNPAHVGQQGRPIPQQPQQQQHPQQHALHHPRAPGLIQQHRPSSPRQSHPSIQSPAQGPYISPHSSTHSLPQQQQHHSPYIGSVPGSIAHHPGEAAYFATHPSPYSTNSAAGSYASSEPSESMATQAAAIGRQSYPPISSYQTPQSNSPASMHSPQTDAHGRAFYPPPMAHNMYYQHYAMPQPAPQPAYGHHSAQPHPSMPSGPSMMMPHPQQQMQQPQHAHPQPPMLDTKPSVPSLPRQSSVISTQSPQQPPQQQQHQAQHHHQQAPQPPQQTPQQPQVPPVQQPGGTPSTPSNPAPGPIPATTPLVVRQDNNGVQWIAFEYSRDRVKMEYTIRCDVESVNVDSLSQEFKAANCVYPRACCGKDQYKGNRLHYESECNGVGWALASLNPNLREKRGLIQRAVDSWRNSNQDPRLRSRRVRRMAKINTRNATKTQSAPPSQYATTQGPGAPGMQGPPQGLPSAPGRLPHMGPGIPQMHHHHSDGSETGGNDVSAGAGYHYSASTQRPLPGSASANLTSPSTPRYTHNFQPTYPQPPGMNTVAAAPSMHGMHTDHGHVSSMTTPIMGPTKTESDDRDERRRLFGDVPDAKRRKIIFVEGFPKGDKCRIQVSLDMAKMDAMPDSHLRTNAVFPRSYFPRTMVSPPGSPRGRAGGNWDDEDDAAADIGIAGTMPTIGKTFVTIDVPGEQDRQLQLAVPRMTKSRRQKEVILNEISQRMSWMQTRQLSGKTVLLQRSLDAYRNRTCKTMAECNVRESDMADHFKTRPGKRKWLERAERLRANQSE